MKKWIMLLLTLATVLTAVVMFALPVSAQTASGKCGAEGDGSNLTWTVNTDTGVLEIKGKGAMEDYDSFDAPWHSYGFYVKNVILPDGLTNIGDHAFESCYRITGITIPGSVKVIGAYAFDDAHLTSLTIPNGVTTIKEQAFDGCRELTSVKIPGSVKTIDSMAFYGCESLTSLTISDGVTTIGNDAFRGCENLKNIAFPDSVTSLGSLVCYDTAYYKDRANWTGDALYVGRHLVTVMSEQPVDKFTVREGTLTIPASCFSYDEELVEVIIPDSVVGIGESAFYNCKKLTNLVIPDSVVVIGKNAFKNCQSLTSAVIPDGVTTIEEETFYGCSNLSSVVIPNSVVAIGKKAFSGCSDLTSVVIPDSVTTIGESAFQSVHCTDVVIGSGVTEIGEEAFSGYNVLENLYLKSPAIANQLTSSEACGELLKSATSVMIANEIGAVPEYIIENYPYTSSETYEGVAYTVYTKIAPPPETTPDAGGEVTDAPATTDKPATDAPATTDAPVTTPDAGGDVTDAPVTTTAPTTTQQVPTTTAPVTDADADTDAVEDKAATFPIWVALLIVAALGVVVVIVLIVKKKNEKA